MGVISRTGVLDGVLREVFTVLIAVYQVLGVERLVAHGIGLLDAAARRSVVAGGGKTDDAAIGELHLLLHKALAKRAAADDGTAVIVLDGAGKDFGRRGRALIDKHHKRYVLVAAATIGEELLPGLLAALGIYYQTVLGQELVGHLHSRLEIAAGVVAQVYHEIGEPALRELGQRDEQLGIGGLREFLHADVAGLVVEHIGGGNALLGDVATRDGKGMDHLGAIAHHAYLDLGVLGALEPVHGLFLGHYLTHKRLAIHAHNLVACQNAGLFGGTVLDDALDVNSVLSDDKLDTDTRERTLQVVGGSLCLLGIDIHRVRVELGENLRDSHIHQRVDVDLVYILVADDMQQIAQAVAAAVDDIQSVAREMIGIECSDDDAYDDAQGHQQRSESVRLFLIHCR